MVGRDQQDERIFRNSEIHSGNLVPEATLCNRQQYSEHTLELVVRGRLDTVVVGVTKNGDGSSVSFICSVICSVLYKLLFCINCSVLSNNDTGVNYHKIVAASTSSVLSIEYLHWMGHSDFWVNWFTDQLMKWALPHFIGMIHTLLCIFFFLLKKSSCTTWLQAD